MLVTMELVDMLNADGRNIFDLIGVFSWKPQCRELSHPTKAARLKNSQHRGVHSLNK
jgi:hypothetical protein